MKKLFFFLTALLFLGGCTLKAPVGSDQEKGNGQRKTIHLAIWSNYITPEMLLEFEKKTGIHVEVSHFSSNEELLAKLQAGASGYDVVTPSDYMIFIMSKMGLLRKLDRLKVPNSKSLEPRYLQKSFDPLNEYSFPYDVGTAGIAINRDLYSGTIRGWKDLFSKTDLVGKLSLMDDAHEVMGAALKSMGQSMNSKDPKQLKAAQEILLKVRPSVKSFTTETLNLLVNREVAVAQAYVMDALQARRLSGGKIEYILPEEGSTFYIDNLAIPSTATHLEEAHALINFLLDPKIGAALATRLFLSPANKDSLALLPPGFQKENSVLFPKQPIQERLEMLVDLGETAQVYDRIWMDLKAVGL